MRAASGAKRNARPSGRFNARGRGAKIAPHLKGHGAWETDGGMRFRSRRVVVKARVVKLAGAGGKAAAAHLRYLQREGAGLDRDSERSPERAATFAYDANLKRVKEVRAGKTVYTVYSRVSGGLVFRDEATDGVKTEYISAGGAALRLKKTGTAAAVPEYLHADHLGSPVAMTNAAGAVVWRESYRPFGKAVRILGSAPANDNNTGFTGHLEDDASGLVYMQARYYDPLVPRFLSTDPIGYQDQLNLYAYVANDPVNDFDAD